MPVVGAGASPYPRPIVVRSGKRIRSRRLAVLTLAVLAAYAAQAGWAGIASGQTIVSLGFDDGYANQYAARSMLAAHGMHATFFIISGSVGSSGYMTWSQLHDLAADGNEIGGHTVDHVSLASVSAAVAQHEVCDDRAALQAQGFQVTDFAYPYGQKADFNAQVEQIVHDCGYDSARTTLWYGADCPSPCTETIPPRDPYATTVVGFSDQTLQQLETVVTNAEAAGGWAQIVIHQVCDSGCAISPSTLGTLLDWLAGEVRSGRVAVETIRDVIHGPPAPPDTTPPAPPLIQSPPDGSSSASTTIVLSGTAEAHSQVEVSDGKGSTGTGAADGAGLWSVTLTDVPQGTHAYTATATDAAGNTSDPSAARSVTVDSVAPETLIVAAPSGTTQAATALVAFAGEPDAVSFACSLDGAPFSACSSPVSLGTLTAGSHTFAVRASGVAGNTDPTPVTRTWTVDPAWTGPVTTSGEALAGGSVSSLPAGAEATPQDPLTATVATPGAGAVSITTAPVSAPPPDGWTFLGRELQVSAPPATAAEPLTLTFRVDGSLLPVGPAPADVAVFRDGARVAGCAGAGAAPDPCVASRTTSGDDLVLVVRSSHASLWNLGAPAVSAAPAKGAGAAPAGSAPATSDAPAAATVTPPVAATPGGGTATRRCVVPRLVGRTVTSARTRLTRAGCRVGTVRRRGRRSGRPVVVAHSRRAGRVLPAGTKVSLTVRRR